MTTYSVWTVFGYDLKQERYDALSYVCDTKQEALTKCQSLHPNFEIYDVAREDY